MKGMTSTSLARPWVVTTDIGTDIGDRCLMISDRFDTRLTQWGSDYGCCDCGDAASSALAWRLFRLLVYLALLIPRTKGKTHLSSPNLQSVAMQLWINSWANEFFFKKINQLAKGFQSAAGFLTTRLVSRRFPWFSGGCPWYAISFCPEVGLWSTIRSQAYAWRQSGFCRHHPGPRAEVVGCWAIRGRSKPHGSKHPGLMVTNCCKQWWSNLRCFLLPRVQMRLALQNALPCWAYHIFSAFEDPTQLLPEATRRRAQLCARLVHRNVMIGIAKAGGDRGM